jgi:hypothetical protein
LLDADCGSFAYGRKDKRSPPAKTKKPPGNRAAFSLGRIVPTEAKPSELSGAIVCLPKKSVKAKSGPFKTLWNHEVSGTKIWRSGLDIRFIFAFKGEGQEKNYSPVRD